LEDKNWNNIAPIVFNGFNLVSEILCKIKEEFEDLHSSVTSLTQCNHKRFSSTQAYLDYTISEMEDNKSAVFG
jgi:hypothetical protein